VAVYVINLVYNVNLIRYTNSLKEVFGKLSEFPTPRLYSPQTEFVGTNQAWFIPTNAAHNNSVVVKGEYNLFCDLNFPSLFPQKPRFLPTTTGCGDGSTVLL